MLIVTAPNPNEAILCRLWVQVIFVSRQSYGTPGLYLDETAGEIHACAGADYTQDKGGHQADMHAQPPAEPAAGHGSKYDDYLFHMVRRCFYLWIGNWTNIFKWRAALRITLIPPNPPVSWYRCLWAGRPQAVEACKSCYDDTRHPYGSSSPR